jgi:hypothetical protein
MQVPFQKRIAGPETPRSIGNDLLHAGILAKISSCKGKRSEETAPGSTGHLEEV